VADGEEHRTTNGPQHFTEEKHIMEDSTGIDWEKIRTAACVGGTPRTTDEPQTIFEPADGDMTPADVVSGCADVLAHIQDEVQDFEDDPSHADLKPEVVDRLREENRRRVVAQYDGAFAEMQQLAADSAEHAQALLNQSMYPLRYSGNAMHQQRAATEISMAMSMPLIGNLPVAELDQALRAKNIDLASALIQRAQTVKTEVTPGERARFAAVVAKYEAMLDLSTVRENLAQRESTLIAVKAAAKAMQTGSGSTALIALGLAGLPQSTDEYMKRQQLNQ